MEKDMNINKITISNFKSIYDLSFEPGKINVLIGANGSGKTTLLEAIGVLSAAMTDRVDSTNLIRKGVRLSSAELYRSRFRDLERESSKINFSLEWNACEDIYTYSTTIFTPTDEDAWTYFDEKVEKNNKIVFDRSQVNAVNEKVSYYPITEKLSSEEYRNALNYIKGYVIYQPDTLILRGNVPDIAQISPIGMNGGRLAEAVNYLLDRNNEMFGSMPIEDVLDMIDWASDFKVGKPRKSSLNPGVPATNQIIEFTDRYLNENTKFTGYDASEGVLYVLFLLSIIMHPSAPRMLGIDSFDHALNPRLARKLTKVICDLIIENKKTVFLTTHNPLVLDGLSIDDDNIRLFVLGRDKHGFVKMNRVNVNSELLQKDQSLSRLWVNGYLGGVPETI